MMFAPAAAACRRLLRLAVPLAVLLTIALPASQASAEEMAVLQLDLGDKLEDRLVEDLRGAISEAFASVNRWDRIELEAARSKMSAVTRDCFTPDCLMQAGEAIGAPAGMRVQLDGEAQIYDYTITMWDLRTGDELKTETGSCELCGRAEVVRNFRESLKAALAATALPKRAAAASRAPVAAAEPAAGQAVLQASVIPADADIFIDGQKVGQGTVTRPLDPGQHEVRFSHEDYRGLRETINVSGDNPQPVNLRVHLAPEGEAPMAATGAEGPIDRLGDSRTTYGYLSMGTGLALVGTGIYLAMLDGQTACDDGVPEAECATVYDFDGAAFITGSVGASLFTIGATLLAWQALAGQPVDVPEDIDAEPAPSEMTIGPTLGDGSAGVSVGGRF